MSYSIAVPAGPVVDFDTRANKAVEDYRAALGQQDMDLDERTAVQLAEVVPAATVLGQKLYGQSTDVDVSATFVGHVNEGNAAGSTCSVYFSTVAKPNPAPVSTPAS